MVSRRALGISVVLILFFSVGFVMMSGAETSDRSIVNESDETPPQDCMQPLGPLESSRAVDRAGPTVTIEATPAGSGTVRLSYSVPDGVDEFLISPGETHDVVHVQDLEETGYGSYRYTGGEEPEIVYVVNRSHKIPHYGTDEQMFANHTDTEEAVATSTIPSHDDTEFRLEFPDGGVAGNDVMFVGEIERIETLQHGVHELHLVVPEASDDAAADQAIQGLQIAKTEIEPYRHTCKSYLFIHPGNVRGYANGADGVSGDQWVDRRPGTHTPVHEYVHLKQQYRLDDDMEWFNEASAMYLTARLLYDSGELSAGEYDAFQTSLDANARWVNLSDPEALEPRQSVGSSDDYLAGALVLAQLDRDLREHGNSTIFDLFVTVGDHEETTAYNVSVFHDDYQDLGGNRSEDELRALLEEESVQKDPVYMAESAYVIPDSIIRQPGDHKSPRESERRVFLALFSGLMIFGQDVARKKISDWYSVYKRDPQ